MLHIHSSNRVESLAARLGDLMAAPFDDVFQQEIVLVHSRGLERWLSLHLAQRFGVCANVRFPFPAPYLNEFMAANATDWPAEKAAAYETNALVWAITTLLPEVADGPAGDLVAEYLHQKDDESPQRRRYHLAATLANLFDRYQVYRPQLLRRWERGRIAEPEAWQARVWRTLVDRHGPYHQIALRDRFFASLKRTPGIELTRLPPRLFLFGISSLAPSYIEVLGALASQSEVHVFYLNPCREYWGDILSRKQRARLRRRKRGGGAAQAWDQLELGLSVEPDFENELLAYFGKLGRDFFDLMLDQDGADHHEHFEAEPEATTLLTALQQDILLLQEGSARARLDLAGEADRPSIQVHSCHSRMREIEVLNDLLLDAFEREPDLQPRDIVVMAPQIDLYTSKIQAVFGRPSDDPRHIPYGIGDRTARLSHSLANVFLRILALGNSRWLASEVLGILENEPVLERFRLNSASLERLQRWLTEAGARWGRDVANKAALGLPPINENTWQFALDRLLLAYAMPLEGKELYHGVLPFDAVEGNDAEIFSHFLQFWDQLSRSVAELEKKHTLAGWAALCRDLVRQFIPDNPDYEREVDFLFTVFQELEDAGAQTASEEAFDVLVIREHLEYRLGDTMGSQGFFTGGVTFCNLLPMRSLPAKVVVLLGMSSAEFPRPDRRLSFDLMQKTPVRGDRSRRHEDRYMFLEALLAARRRLVLIYTGQSIKDNSEISQSVFISQIQDYLERVYQVSPSDYQIHHRLQPFSPFYFKNDSTLFSYAEEYAAGPEPRRPLKVEISDKVAGPPGDAAEKAPEESLALEALVAFFQQPVAEFYRQRLRLYEAAPSEQVRDTEPIDLDALETWQIHQRILDLLRQGVTPNAITDLLRASGQLPHGSHGKELARHMHADVAKFLDAGNAFLGGPELEAVEVDLSLDGFRITGRIDGIHDQGLSRLRFGRLRHRDHIRLWIEHLVLHSLESFGHRKPSRFLGRDGKILTLSEFATPKAAQHELSTLLQLRAQGLERPLAFFPLASTAYVRAVLNPKQRHDCWDRAREAWNGRPNSRGDCADYYHKLAFGRRENPIDESFAQTSRAILEPVFHLTQS